MTPPDHNGVKKRERKTFQEMAPPDHGGVIKKERLTLQEYEETIRTLQDRLEMETEMRENLQYAINEITEHLFTSLEELSSQTRELRKRNMELEIQDRIVKIINQEINLDNVLKTLLHQALMLFPHGDRGAFLQYSSQTNQFRFSAVEGYHSRAGGEAAITYDDLVKMITRDVRKLDDGLIMVNGIDYDDGMPKKNPAGTHSVLAMALSMGKKFEDFLILDNTRDPDDFKPSEIKNLLRFREHAISAISKAKILKLLRAEKEKTEQALKNARNTNKKLEAARKKLEEMTLTDPLTRLHNRRFLTTFIHRELAKSLRAHDHRAQKTLKNADIGFSMLDIDHFKYVNDTFGHDGGDMVLKQVARILRDNCRESDIIIRWGGEEFLIVSLGINREDAHILPGRLRKAIKGHAFVVGNDQTLNRTCSIGFACFPFVSGAPRSLDYEQIISIADKCLYAAKTSGRNAWVGAWWNRAPDHQADVGNIHTDFETLVKRNAINVRTSIPDIRELSFFRD